MEEDGGGGWRRGARARARVGLRRGVGAVWSGAVQPPRVTSHTALLAPCGCSVGPGRSKTVKGGDTPGAARWPEAREAALVGWVSSGELSKNNNKKTKEQQQRGGRAGVAAGQRVDGGGRRLAGRILECVRHNNAPSRVAWSERGCACDASSTGVSVLCYVCVYVCVVSSCGACVSVGALIDGIV